MSAAVDDAGSPGANAIVGENGELPEKFVTSNEDDTPSETAGPARDIHGIRWALVIIAIMLSLFLYALDNTITADIIPSIIVSLGEPGKLSWITVGFALGGVCLILPLGKLYAKFDPKKVFLGSAVLFLAGSALCGGAPTMNAMIVGRVIAGIGGNGLYIGTVTLVSLYTTERERPGYLGSVAVTWGAGTVLGPIVGGAFKKITWRWAFYINPCISALLAPVWLFLIPSSKSPAARSSKRRLREFDFLGTILIIGTILPLIMAIAFGGTEYAWNSWRTIFLFVVFVVCLVAFFLQQSFSILTTPRERLFPIHFLKNKDAVLLFILSAAIDGSFFIPIYVIPLYFQFTRGDSALVSAWRLLPYIIPLCIGILSNGFMMGWSGRFKPWFITGSILNILGGVLLSRISVDTPAAHIYGFQVLAGLGAGAFDQAGFPVLFALVDPEDIPFATSFITLAQISGLATSLALSTTIFVNRALVDLAPLLPDASSAELQSAISGYSGDLFAGVPQDVRREVLEVLVAALRKDFIICYSSASLCLVLSVFLTHRRLFD